MRSPRLVWQFFIGYLSVTIVAVVAVGVLTALYFRNFQLEEISDDLQKRASLISEIISDDYFRGDYAALDSLCHALGIRTKTRITVILPSGKVICDNEENPAAMDNHADRPEIMEALAGKNGKSIRHSFTLGIDMLYVAVPVMRENRVEYVLRTSVPLVSIKNNLSFIYSRMAILAFLLIAIIAVISFILTGRISRPIRELRMGAERFAGGDFEKKIYTTGSHEISSLADSMNQMAGELHKRIEQISLQKGEQEAILTSMTEGVIAIDNDERILSFNLAVEKLLNIGRDAKGKFIREAVLNSDFLSFVEKTLSEKENIEGEIVLYDHEEKHLSVQGTSLLDSSNCKIGALIVLNDITKIRQLEKIRKDFVSNVSHELRTPITSIKGYMETAMDEIARSGPNAGGFLSTALRQVDRLNHIIEDLLALSRIEQSESEATVDRRTVELKSMLDSVVQSCDFAAKDKNININILCPDDIKVRVQEQLFEQAVINLVENAINYSGNGSEINLRAGRDGDQVIVEVEDHGIGIEKKHLGRIFERFYRVDRARSRSTGGTGLGLAIVKHIVRAQGGTVSVESAPGKGSTFIIRMPG